MRTIGHHTLGPTAEMIDSYNKGMEIINLQFPNNELGDV